jgi:DNA-binding NarL/FixJ family response regulator
MTRILLVDDHALVRKGLRFLLEQRETTWTVDEADSPEVALSKVRAESWDIVVMDIDLPGQNGIDLIKRMRRDRPRLPVLVLSIHDERRYGTRALQAGACGYVSKASPAEQVADAVHKILNGGRYVSPTLAESLVSMINGDRPVSARLHSDLSDREFQIFRLIASGRTASAIARDLSLSVKTVHTHRSRALKKMGMHNNSELTRYAFQHDLVD